MSLVSAFARQARTQGTGGGNNEGNRLTTNNDNNSSDSDDDIFKRAYMEEELTRNALWQLTVGNAAGAEDVKWREQLETECKEAFANFLNTCKHEINGSWMKVIEWYPTNMFIEESKKWEEQQWEGFKINCDTWN